MTYLSGNFKRNSTREAMIVPRIAENSNSSAHSRIAICTGIMHFANWE